MQMCCLRGHVFLFALKRMPIGLFSHVSVEYHKFSFRLGCYPEIMEFSPAQTNFIATNKSTFTILSSQQRRRLAACSYVNYLGMSCYCCCVSESSTTHQIPFLFTSSNFNCNAVGDWYGIARFN